MIGLPSKGRKPGMKPTPMQIDAYIQMALHDIDELRGPQRESVQVFREFYRAIQKRMEPKEVDLGPPVGRELI